MVFDHDVVHRMIEKGHLDNQNYLLQEDCHLVKMEHNDQNFECLLEQKLEDCHIEMF